MSEEEPRFWESFIDGEIWLKFAQIAIIALFTLLFLAVGVALGLYMLYPHIADELTVEVGTFLPAATDFMARGIGRPEIEWEDEVNMEQPGNYRVLVRIMNQEKRVTLHVADTMPPVVKTQSVTVNLLDKVSAEDFIAYIKDMSNVRVDFAIPVDTSIPGKEIVSLVITDDSHNQTWAEAELEVLPETEAPVIHGVEERTITLGERPDYFSGVTVTDNYDENAALEVDDSMVNLSRPGIYQLLYIATDSSGNKTYVPTIFNVIPQMNRNITVESVTNTADQILRQIISPNMSQYEKARTIYEWCRINLEWEKKTNRDNWLQAAYDGLTDRQGDSFSHTMAAKLLLTRAGIPNRIVVEVDPDEDELARYWNQIDVGEGWRHMDCVRRESGSSYFYLTDSQVKGFYTIPNTPPDSETSL